MKSLKKSISTSSVNKEIKELKPYFKSSVYWKFECYAVARGVAAGLAGAVIPGFQIFYAAILVVLLRGNLPIALVCTLVTNPFTVIPFTYFTYYIGTLIIGNHKAPFVMQKLHWDFSSFHAFWTGISAWLLQFGKAYFIGVPFVSLALGILGYFGTIFIWKLFHPKK